ncbi:MAG: hypothetical protein RR374_03370 [Clostridia bacterium]
MKKFKLITSIVAVICLCSLCLVGCFEPTKPNKYVEKLSTSTNFYVRMGDARYDVKGENMAATITKDGKTEGYYIIKEGDKYFEYEKDAKGWEKEELSAADYKDALKVVTDAKNTVCDKKYFAEEAFTIVEGVYSVVDKLTNTGFDLQVIEKELVFRVVVLGKPVDAGKICFGLSAVVKLPSEAKDAVLKKD